MPYSYRPSLGIALALVSSLAASAGCSAVVSPDPGRLDRSGADVGSGGSDAGPGIDTGVVGVDADLGGVDADVVGVDTGVVGVDAGTGCAAGLVDCGGTCFDLSRDPMHCGSCAMSCGPGSVCTSGTCGGCSAGDPACSGGLGDRANCGPSHASCHADQLCIGGACVCRPPLALVAGACIDLATDPNNCGTAGTRCADLCAGGHCVTSCPTGTRDCGGACVNTRSDPANCGSCGRACGPDQACQDGGCRDLAPARGCTTCPCDACGDVQCCLLPRVMIPYCLEADRCP